MERLPNGSGAGGGADEGQQQGMYYSGGQDPRMTQERYNQMMASSQPGSMQGYTPDQQMVRTPEMVNGAPQQQLSLDQQQHLTAQRQAMLQRQYSSPALTGRAPLNGADQRSKSSQNLIGNVQQQQRPQEGGMNGMANNPSQMAMNQGGFMSPTYANQTPNGQQPMRPQSAQQLAQMQQLQQQQYQQQMQQQQTSSQQMTMSMQINSQMTQMNIQVGNQNAAQQQQHSMLNQQQYTPQQLQQLQQGQGQPQVHTAQQAQTLQQMQQSQMTNGQYAVYTNQMGMGQMGQGTAIMQQQQLQMSDLQLEQHARLLRQRQHPHLSAQPRSASMGSLPIGQQPPQYPYPYGQHPGSGPRPNGLNPYTANGTPVPNSWLMAYQTEMPPAFLNYYLPGKPHPYFDHTRRNLLLPYPAGTKDLGDRNPGEPFTFGFLPDSIYYVPANDRRNNNNNQGKGSDANFGSDPSTSKASPKKRGAAAAGGAAGAKKQRRTNSDQADDARFVQPYPPNPSAQQQRVVGVTAGAGMFPSSSGQAFDGFTQPSLPMQQMMQTPHVQLQRQMSAPAYSGLAQSAQEAMQNARQQQAMANAQAQYAAQHQQQQGPSTSAQQMTHDGYQQSPNGEAMYSSEMQWRAQYAQQPSTPTSSSSSQPVFRSPPPQQQQSFNNGSQQPQQNQQPSSANDQMYWNQQQ